MPLCSLLFSFGSALVLIYVQTREFIDRESVPDVDQDGKPGHQMYGQRVDFGIELQHFIALLLVVELLLRSALILKILPLCDASMDTDSTEIPFLA